MLACALLHNVFTILEWHDQSRGKDGASDAILIPALASVLKRTKLEEDLSNGYPGLSSLETAQLAPRCFGVDQHRDAGLLGEGRQRRNRMERLG